MSSLVGMPAMSSPPWLPLTGGTLLGNLTLPAAGALAWSTRAILTSPADGALQINTAAASAGVWLVGSTTNELRVLTNAGGASATVRAFKVVNHNNSGAMTDGYFSIGTGRSIVFSSTSLENGTADLSLVRNAAGVLRVGDGSTGWADIQASRLLSPRAAGGVGYATGAGGTVTQLTSKSTGVTLNTVTGEITMNGAALGSGAEVQFTLTNSSIAQTDVMALNHGSGGTMGAYSVQAMCGPGSAVISVRNVSAGSLSEAIVLRFAIIKGATS